MINQINLEKDIENEKYKYLIFMEITGLTKIYENFGYVEALSINKLINKKLYKHGSKKFKGYQSIQNRFTILTEDIQIFKNFLRDVKQDIPDYILLIDLKVHSGVCKTFGGSYLDSIKKANAALNIAIIDNKEILEFDSTNVSISKLVNKEDWKLKTLHLIKNNLIIPFFQPILDIKTGKIVKYEVLARGNLSGKIALPFEFLPAAEILQILPIITRMIISESFKFFEDKPLIKFSINITEFDLIDPSFSDFIQNKTKEFNIQASNVTLELLENIKSINITHYNEMISNLKDLGFSIAIDDFGIENSNFSRLMAIDCDYLKIDAIFIKDIHKNHKNQTIVESIVNVAQVLKIKTIAEYVESKEIFECIKSLGVDFAQGYYIGKPSSKIVNS